MKKFLFLFLLSGSLATAQLNCTVTVNSETIANANPQTFKTLQKAISEFVNKTDWTGSPYKQHERINCSMYITLNSYNADQYTATIQVQSARPIYNSTYSSPVLNINDKDFSFRYVEFQQMVFNPADFDSNLISVLAFYCYMIIGADGDTFSPKGGDPWLEVAQQIASVAQQSNYKGWQQSDGNQNRFFLINDMMSSTFEPFRDAMYQYHFEGLDKMADDPKNAKQNVANALQTLSQLHSVRPNSYLSRVFFDAKSDEIVSIFSGGPNVSISEVVDNLNRISPLNSNKWSQIKY